MTGNENFESRLLSELRQVAAENPAPSAQAARPKRYGRFAAAGAGLAAVVAGVAIYAGSGDNTTSAYAVESEPDGMVTVEIKSLKDAGGLERSLNEAGVPAEVNYSPVMATICAIEAEPGDNAKSDEKGFSKTSPLVETSGTTETAEATEALKTLPAMPAKAGALSETRTDADGTTFSIDPGTIKKGEKLYITTSGGGPKDAELAAAPTSVAISVGDKPADEDC
ncbi:MAG: hypothetical protein J0H98_01845 [Solirubrobacterales bacterium]|nr:hypothetical protein [Solirubrobacterales bacterium]